MKKIVTILTLTFALALTVRAQIFIEEDEANSRVNTGDVGVYVDLPDVYGSGNDWFAPIGSGIALFAALSGTYLIGKHRKDRKQ